MITRGQTKERRFTEGASAKEPWKDHELRSRIAAHRDGSARLATAIDALIEQTAERLAVPSAWRDHPLPFARAYLGLEVATPPRGDGD